MLIIIPSLALPLITRGGKELFYLKLAKFIVKHLTKRPKCAILPFKQALRSKTRRNTMKNVFGGLAVLCSSGVVALALYLTKDAQCLWGAPSERRPGLLLPMG